MEPLDIYMQKNVNFNLYTKINSKWGHRPKYKTNQ